MTQLVRIEPGNNIEEAHMRNRQLIARWVYEHGKDGNVVEMVKRDGKTYVKVNDYAKCATSLPSCWPRCNASSPPATLKPPDTGRDLRRQGRPRPPHRGTRTLQAAQPCPLQRLCKPALRGSNRRAGQHHRHHRQLRRGLRRANAALQRRLLAAALAQLMSRQRHTSCRRSRAGFGAPRLLRLFSTRRKARPRTISKPPGSKVCPPGSTPSPPCGQTSAPRRADLRPQKDTQDTPTTGTTQIASGKSRFPSEKS